MKIVEKFEDEINGVLRVKIPFFNQNFYAMMNERFANSELLERLTEICNLEEESGVKNQYTKALKKASKIRL